MKVFVNNIIEKLSEIGHEPKRFMIKKIKTVNENVHAVLVDLDDDKTELLVAISVLEDVYNGRTPNLSLATCN